MAIKVKSTAVSTTAVAITLADTDITSKGFVVIRNQGTNTVYLGPSNVTAATGLPLAANATLGPIEIKNNESLFAICAATESATVKTLQTQA
jgi:hypothetical protein